MFCLSLFACCGFIFFIKLAIRKGFASNDAKPFLYLEIKQINGKYVVRYLFSIHFQSNPHLPLFAG
jgi:hypothetical protein